MKWIEIWAMKEVVITIICVVFFIGVAIYGAHRENKKRKNKK